MELISTIEYKVPFYDVDSIKMVWHGNYVKYLENGREAFGEKYGLEYMTIYNNGYLAPIADMHISYKKVAQLGDTLVIETKYIESRGAKIVFEYTIKNKEDNSLILTASTIQLFTLHNGELETSTPLFYRNFKNKWNLK